MSGISDVVVGLDVGTSSIKALALTDRGGVFGPVRVATPTTRYPDGTAEHDPADLWDAVTGCLHALTRFLPDAVRVGALATATVGEAIVPVNDAGAELRPMIAWYDQRGAAYLARWRHDPGTRAVYQITGQTADERAGANKILWIKDHEPGIAADTARWLGMAAWTNLRLCGVAVTDPSLAARTMLFDRHTLDWSAPLLEAADLTACSLPAVTPGGTIVGYLSADAAARSGLPGGTPVVAGGHDHLCAALAARGGSEALVDSVGSAESLVGTTERPLPDDPGWDAHVNCYPDVESGRYALSAQVGLTGVVLEWVAREIYGLESGTDASRVMFEDLRAPLRPTGIVFFPQFGRGTAPRWDPSAALGAFIGLAPAHHREDLLQAALEASCFSLRHSLEWMAGHGAATGLIRVEGGAATNSTWSQLKADVLDRPLETIERSELTALGAALLAAVGADWYPDPRSAAAVTPLPTRRWTPSPEGTAAYGRLYSEVFLRLADGLAPLHRALKTMKASDR